VVSGGGEVGIEHRAGDVEMATLAGRQVGDEEVAAEDERRQADDTVGA
jgi:hypothetical protein